MLGAYEQDKIYMFNRLDRYIIRQVLGPLVMTLGVAAMLLLLERMLRLFDFVQPPWHHGHLGAEQLHAPG